MEWDGNSMSLASMHRAGKCDNLEIDEVWPVSTEIIPNGGIGVYWHGDIGFGEFKLYWGKDEKLHASTEFLDKNDKDKKFTAEILRLLINEIIIDD